MGFVVVDVFNVEVSDYRTGEKLFTIDSALDSNLTIDNVGCKSGLSLTQCYLGMDVFEGVMNGSYEERELSLVITGQIRDSDGRTGTLEISANHARLEQAGISSRGNRIMTNDICFDIIKKDKEGNRTLFIKTRMDDGYGE